MMGCDSCKQAAVPLADTASLLAMVSLLVHTIACRPLQRPVLVQFSGDNCTFKLAFACPNDTRAVAKPLCIPGIAYAGGSVFTVCSTEEPFAVPLKQPGTPYSRAHMRVAALLAAGASQIPNAIAAVLEVKGSWTLADCPAALQCTIG